MYVFEAMGETTPNYSAFDSSKWIENEVQKNRSHSDGVRDDHILLVRALSSVRSAHILDFGGSLGAAYAALQSAYPDRDFRYTIVETPAVCAAGRDYHKTSDIFFTEKISDLKKIDVVYVQTSLQYARNWRETLNTLIDLAPSIFILSHASVGDIRTFQAIQNYYERKIPYWWISISDLKEVFSTHGYACAIAEEDQAIHDSAFCESIAADDRLRATRNLIFRRILS